MPIDILQQLSRAVAPKYIFSLLAVKLRKLVIAYSFTWIYETCTYSLWLTLILPLLLLSSHPGSGGVSLSFSFRGFVSVCLSISAKFKFTTAPWRETFHQLVDILLHYWSKRCASLPNQKRKVVRVAASLVLFSWWSPKGNRGTFPGRYRAVPLAAGGGKTILLGDTRAELMPLSAWFLAVQWGNLLDLNWSLGEKSTLWLPNTHTHTLSSCLSRVPNLPYISDVTHTVHCHFPQRVLSTMLSWVTINMWVLLTVKWRH